MLFPFIIVTILLIIVSVLLYFSVRRNLKYDDMIEQFTDQLDQSLDIIDTCYGRISRAATQELLSDEPIVRSLMSDIKMTQRAVLLVANKITTFDESLNNDDDEGHENQRS